MKEQEYLTKLFNYQTLKKIKKDVILQFDNESILDFTACEYDSNQVTYISSNLSDGLFENNSQIGNEFYLCKFKNINFKYNLLHKGKFDDCIIENTVFDYCNLVKTDFLNCKFKNVNFINCKLNWSYFDSCEFVNCKFINCEFEGITFTDSNIYDTIFNKNIINVEFHPNIDSNKYFRNGTDISNLINEVEYFKG